MAMKLWYCEDVQNAHEPSSIASLPTVSSDVDDSFLFQVSVMLMLAILHYARVTI
jgi:hypothetical protein